MVASRRAVPRLPWWEKILTVLVLFAFTKPFFFRFESGSNFGILEYGPSGNIYNTLVHGTIVGLVLRRRREVWRTARGDLLVWVLVGLTALSFAWSIEPYISFRAGLFLVATTVAGVYLAAAYSNAEQVEVTAGALALGAGLSILVAVVAPSYGIDDGRWLGVFLHKNYLGRYMALAAIASLLLAARSGPWRRWAPAGVVVAVALVLLSGSSTAIVVILALAALTPLCLAIGAQIHLAIAIWSSALLLAGMGVVLFMAAPEAVFQALGRDASLTGRTALWQAIGPLILLRPWLGYGYQAFWFVPESSEDVKDVAGWAGTSAHNGFVELALSIGLMGLVVFALGFLRSSGTAVRDLRQSPGVESLWPAVFLAYFLAYNITETSVLLPNNLLWVLYVAVVLSLRRRPAAPVQARVKARRFEPMVARLRPEPRPIAEGGRPASSPAWKHPE